MPVSLAHPAGLLALAVPVILLLVLLRHRPPLSRRGARLAVAVRLLLLASLGLSLAGLEISTTPSARTTIALADRSASLLTAGTGEAEAVRDLQRRLGPDDRLGVISFGGDAQVEDPPSSSPSFSGFGTSPDPNHTDIAAALRLAVSEMPDGSRHQAVVLSDGRQNRGDALAQARQLREQGLRLDVVPLSVPSGPEVRVDSVSTPSTVPAGAAIHVHVSLVSNVRTSGTLTVDVDGAGSSARPVDIAAGETGADLTLPPSAPGLHRIRAVIDPAADTLPQNNTGEALVQVLGPQRVLVIEGHAGAGANVAAALRAASIDSTVTEAVAAPHTPVDLAAYQAVALVDVPASALGPERMEALATATRDLGVGLAAFGGPDTFGPGGFSGTPLETALPIDMRISNQDAKPPVAVVLVLESVESSAGDAVVRGAASALVEKLSPRDLVGVTDALHGLAVPLQHVTDRRRLEDAIAGIPAFGDPPSYEPFLRDAEDALLSHPEATRHVILLGDGDAQPTSTELIAGMVRQGITVSAVGVDIDHNAQSMATMQAVAAEGKGRFYQSQSPSEVPDILLRESNDQLKPWVVEQRFAPTAAGSPAALSGIDLQRLPALGGYVASTPKAAAEVGLRGPSRDPILAEWQYGAGRAAAWTSDTEGRWSSDLLGWDQGGRLLANVVASTLPLAADPALSVSSRLTGDTAHIIAEVHGAPPDAVVSADVVAPDRSTGQLVLPSTRAGRYEADLPASQMGGYLMRVAVESGGRILHAATSGVAVPYSPEYRFLGTDRRFLAELAAAGGGAVLTDAAAAARLPVPAATAHLSLALLLLALAALLLPLDVAVRRLTFQPGDAAVWRQAVRPPPREVPPAPSEPTLGRLRRRVDEVRAERRERAAPPPPF